MWPESHVVGNDIWVCTVDGTMSASNEIAGKDNPKDPQLFSHKHHSAGFNAEVAVSVKESRCIWINGPGPAGRDVDLVLFRQKGGLREKLLETGKKAIGDGGYSGEPLVVSTPNGHDSASVRKFKARALKRHEKFNNMLKNFKVLSAKFRHTAHKKDDSVDGAEEADELDKHDRAVTAFEAVAVICQYQLENGSQLAS